MNKSKRNFLKKSVLSLGVLSLSLPLIRAVGFHSASEILPVAPLIVTSGTLDLSLSSNFNWTPSGTDVLEFSNETSGKEGKIYLSNPNGYAITLGSEVLADSSCSSILSVAGDYVINYWCHNGTNVNISYSGNVNLPNLPLSSSGFITSDSNSTTQSSPFTFSSKSLGTEAPNRKILVTVGNYNASQSTVTVAGISATKIATGPQTGAFGECSIWEAEVPTGTTGDIVVTPSGSTAGCGIGIYAVYTSASGISASDTDSVTHGVSTDVSGTATVPADGIMIGFCLLTNIVVTAAWTGLTEDYEFAWDGSGYKMTGAFNYYSTLQTSKTISVAETADSQSYRQLIVITYAAS